MVATGLEISFTFEGRCKIALTLQEKPSMGFLEGITSTITSGKLLDVEVKPFRKKRSLDSNSYAWLLIGKIADKLNTSKDELYIEMLKRYGQREGKLISVVAEAVDIIYRATQNHCTEVGESELNGKVFKHLAILIGSSQYDTSQMSIFINGVISDAIELGIDTMTENEKNKMLAAWDGRK